MASIEGIAVFPAFAADMAPAPIYTKEPAAPPPPTSWTGFYLGGGIGVRSANVSEQTLSADLVDPVRSVMDPTTCSFTPCGTISSLDHTAFRFSPYLGYNWQFARQWLVGLEGDVGFGSKTSTIDGVPLPGAGLLSLFPTPGDSFAVKTGWDASARARVGYLATPNLLVYATGGAAWQHVEATSVCGPNNLHFTCSPLANNPLNLQNPATVADGATKLGFTIGGGVETMVDGHWLVRGEVRYSDFGSITNTDVRTALLPSNGLTTSYKLRLTTETALVGVAYKF